MPLSLGPELIYIHPQKLCPESDRLDLKLSILLNYRNNLHSTKKVNMTRKIHNHGMSHANINVVKKVHSAVHYIISNK